MRDLQERFEQKWPATECCSACIADKASRQDPVLNQIKLDPQGSTGVGGNLVNNAGLGAAFERFEKDKKEEPS